MYRTLFLIPLSKRGPSVSLEKWLILSPREGNVQDELGEPYCARKEVFHTDAHSDGWVTERCRSQPEELPMAMLGHFEQSK